MSDPAATPEPRGSPNPNHMKGRTKDNPAPLRWDLSSLTGSERRFRASIAAGLCKRGGLRSPHAQAEAFRAVSLRRIVLACYDLKPEDLRGCIHILKSAVDDLAAIQALALGHPQQRGPLAPPAGLSPPPLPS